MKPGHLFIQPVFQPGVFQPNFITQVFLQAADK
jgi:hypothetical protein